MNHLEVPASLQPLVETWTAALGKTVSQFTNAEWKVGRLDREPSAHITDDPLLYTLTVTGSITGSIYLEFDRPEAMALAVLILGDSESTGFTAEHGETLLEVLGAATKAFRVDLSGRAGDVEVACNATASLPEELADVNRTWLAADSAGHQIRFKLRLDHQLEASLASLPATSMAPESAPGPAASIAPIDETNLSLVLDVELNVLLRFGQRELSLREILDLTSGSVIELDRRVEEPVELLLDGRVIARGEAAIVDGNYGLRITEIMAPAQGGR